MTADPGETTGDDSDARGPSGASVGGSRRAPPALGPRRRVAGALALGLAALALAFPFTEGALRLLDRVYCFDDSSGIFYDPNPLYGWQHTRNFTGWAKRCFGHQPEWANYVHMNSLGLHDREIPYARTDAYRILVLGDSYTEGLQVGDDGTFAKQLERRLGSGTRRVEVINAGHAAYGTDNELLFYRHEGRKYHADLVLLVFNTENDVLENYTPLLRRIPLSYPDKPYFLFEDGSFTVRNYPMPEPHGIVPAIQHELHRHSVAYRFLSTLRLPRLVPAVHAAAQPPSPPGQLGVLLKEYPPEWDDAWRVTRALVRRLRRDVARDGSRFAVVVINGAYEISERRWRVKLYFLKQPSDLFDPTKAQRIITHWLAHAHVPYVPLMEGFRDHLRATGTDGYFRWDPHWNAEGHAIAAELISRGLQDLDLVPGH